MSATCLRYDAVPQYKVAGTGGRGGNMRARCHQLHTCASAVVNTLVRAGAGFWKSFQSDNLNVRPAHST
eukprot:353791-Chlamydomonas_euryale.AAC.6